MITYPCRSFKICIMTYTRLLACLHVYLNRGVIQQVRMLNDPLMFDQKFTVDQCLVLINKQNTRSIQVNTKHLYDICTMLHQRRRRWADVVQMYTNVLCVLGY